MADDGSNGKRYPKCSSQGSIADPDDLMQI